MQVIQNNTGSFNISIAVNHDNVYTVYKDLAHMRKKEKIQTQVSFFSLTVPDSEARRNWKKRSTSGHRLGDKKNVKKKWIRYHKQSKWFEEDKKEKMSNSIMIVKNKNMMKQSTKSEIMECNADCYDKVYATRWMKFYHKLQGLLCYSMPKSSSTSKSSSLSSNQRHHKQHNHHHQYSSNEFLKSKIRFSICRTKSVQTISDQTQQTEHTETYHESFILDNSELQFCIHALQMRDIVLPCLLDHDNNNNEYSLSIPASFYKFFDDAKSSLLLLKNNMINTCNPIYTNETDDNNNIDNNEEDIKDVQYIRYETFVPLDSTRAYNKKTLPTIMELYGEEDNDFVEYQEEFNTSYNWNCEDSYISSCCSMGAISSCSSHGQGTLVSV
jgi:hypothetical protein